MTVDDRRADKVLRDVAATQELTLKLINYDASGIFFILWGVLVTAGFILEYFRPEWANLTWTLIRTLGVAGGFGLAYLLSKNHRPITDWRLLYALLASGLMGWLWMFLIPIENVRALDVHWTLIFMFSLVVAGIWIGRIFVAAGLAISALTLAGFLFTGGWFHLWMAACNGGGMIVCGLWLRMKGVSRYAE